MKRLGWLVLVLASASCDALSYEASLFPTGNNDRNCVLNPGVCGTDELCDPVKKVCVSGGGRCVTSPDCVMASGPVCSEGMCKPCDSTVMATGDKQCSDWSTGRKEPILKSVCIAGTCMECRVNSDCKRPGRKVCDQAKNTCVGCTEDNQCPVSQICKKDDSVLATNDTLSNIGDCVAPDAVAYVNKNDASCSDIAADAGTMAKPYCQIQKAVSAGKTYIRVQAGTDYDAVLVSSRQRVIIYGPGKDMASIVSVRVTGGAQLTLQDIGIKVSSTAPAATTLLACDSGSYLTVRRALLNGLNGRNSMSMAPYSLGGLIADQCQRVIVERTKIQGVNGNGLFISGGGNHFVVNNAIIGSGANVMGEQRAGLRIGQGVSSGVFAFNTLTNNLLGVLCETSTVAITDSIVQDNVGAANLMGCTNMMRVVTSGAMIDTAANADPKITADSSAVVDKATANQMIKEDYFGNPRPQGSGYDIGFHEYK
jgi:hypothetical protein